jgi:multidrug efflux pump subunit AcrA (membrane-fusion protein)
MAITIGWSMWEGTRRMPIRETSAAADTSLTSTLLRCAAFGLTFVAGAAAMLAGRSWFAPATIEPRPVVSDHKVALQPSDPAPPKLLEPAPMTEKPIAPSTKVEAAPADHHLRLTGITEPAPDRFAKLPLATSQAVAFVDVRPGDRIKKGHQVFSHWESPERLQAVKTEMEKTRKLLEVAQARHSAAEKTLARVEKLGNSASRQEREDAQTAVAVRQKECEAAELAASQAESHFNAMEFEFKQAFVTSPIDGIVAAVDVLPGERRVAGGAFRGVTILDPRVLHCRCFLTTSQLAQLKSSASGAEPRAATVELEGQTWPATVLWTGIQADAHGRLPVVLEIKNTDETLPAGVQVQVSFDAGDK